MKRSSASPARGVLPRAIRYLGHYRRDTALAYAALLLATGAQLMVPLLIQRMIDGVTRGVVSQQTASLPETARTMIASRMGITLAELARAGQDPVQALVVSGMLILVFAAVRGAVRLPPGLHGRSAFAERGLRPAQRAVRQDPAAVLQLPRPQPDRPADDPRHRRRREGAPVHRPGPGDGGSGAWCC